MRILFVTYYFPPSGGSGVQRPMKFVRYLPKFGWKPTVLTVDPQYASYSDIDEAMVSEIPAEATIERTRAWDPYALYGKFLGKKKEDSIVVHMVDTEDPGWKDHMSRWIRANVFIPDARIGWYPFAVRRALALHSEEPFDAVLTTGPPHSIHLIGRKIARKTGLPWVADFRDPWTRIFYRDVLPITSIADRIEKRLERSVMKEASAVVAVTRKDQEMYEEMSGREVQFIPNGYDPADFEGDIHRFDAVFVFSYVGVLNETRNPDGLWPALKGRATEFPRLRIELTGRIEGSVLDSIKASADDVAVSDYVEHAEAVRRIRRSSLLLFVVNKGAENANIIPAKLYEYLASGVPILGVGPVDGDSAKLIREAGAGDMFDYDNTEGMISFLLKHYSAWDSGEPIAGGNPKVASRFSRVELTRQLSDLLRSIAGQP